MSEMEWIVLWLASGLVLALLMAFTDWWNGEDVTLSGVGMMVVLTLGGFGSWAITIVVLLGMCGMVVASALSAG